MLPTEGCCRSETKDQRYVVKGDMFGPVAEAIFFRESSSIDMYNNDVGKRFMK
jgi:hypothetical protein